LLTRQVCKIFHREQYKQHLGIVARLVKDLAKYPNVEIYGFGYIQATQDLNLYRDETHYDLKLNDIMLTRIAKGENRLTPENVLDYLVRFDAKVNHFKLQDEWTPEKLAPGNALAQHR
jgi:hypothetical protein